MRRVHSWQEVEIFPTLTDIDDDGDAAQLTVSGAASDEEPVVFWDRELDGLVIFFNKEVSR